MKLRKFQYLVLGLAGLAAVAMLNSSCSTQHGEATSETPVNNHQARADPAGHPACEIPLSDTGYSGPFESEIVAFCELDEALNQAECDRDGNCRLNLSEEFWRLFDQNCEKLLDGTGNRDSEMRLNDTEDFFADTMELVRERDYRSWCEVSDRPVHPTVDSKALGAIREQVDTVLDLVLDIGPIGSNGITSGPAGPAGPAEPAALPVLQARDGTLLYLEVARPGSTLNDELSQLDCEVDGDCPVPGYLSLKGYEGSPHGREVPILALSETADGLVERFSDHMAEILSRWQDVWVHLGLPDVVTACANRLSVEVHLRPSEDFSELDPWRSGFVLKARPGSTPLDQLLDERFRALSDVRLPTDTFSLDYKDTLAFQRELERVPRLVSWVDNSLDYDQIVQVDMSGTYADWRYRYLVYRRIANS